MIPGLLDYIKENHTQKTAEEMAEHLGTSVVYVQAVCYHNNLESYMPHPPWSEREIKLLKEKYPHAPWNELFNCFPTRDYNSIRHKANRLGIVRNKPQQIYP